jgi:uncharacterized protein
MHIAATSLPRNPLQTAWGDINQYARNKARSARPSNEPGETVMKVPEMRECLAAALDDARSGNDPQRLCTLRLIATAIKDRDIALRAEGRERLCDEEIARLLHRMACQHEEKASALEAAGDVGRAADQRRLAGIVAELMPPSMDAGSILAACETAVAETGARGLRDIGRCMDALKRKHGTALDLPAAGAVVRGMLR